MSVAFFKERNLFINDSGVMASRRMQLESSDLAHPSVILPLIKVGQLSMSG